MVAPGEDDLVGLGLPAGAEGLPPEQAAALVARRVREVQGADMGLAAIARGTAASLVAYIALDTGAGTVAHARDMAGRAADLVQPWVANTALDAVRRALL